MKNVTYFANKRKDRNIIVFNNFFALKNKNTKFVGETE